MSTLGSLTIGALAVAALAAGWVAVQGAWRRVFPGAADPDVLAARGGCYTCTGSCQEPCARRRAATRPAEEDSR